MASTIVEQIEELELNLLGRTAQAEILARRQNWPEHERARQKRRLEILRDGLETFRRLAGQAATGDGRAAE